MCYAQGLGPSLGSCLCARLACDCWGVIQAVLCPELSFWTGIGAELQPSGGAVTLGFGRCAPERAGAGE